MRSDSTIKNNNLMDVIIYKSKK